MISGSIKAFKKNIFEISCLKLMTSSKDVSHFYGFLKFLHLTGGTV